MSIVVAMPFVRD